LTAADGRIIFFFVMGRVDRRLEWGRSMPGDRMEYDRVVQQSGFPGAVRFALILGIGIGLALPAFASQDQLRHETTVTAVEVPVRVLRNGETVRGLTRDDFEVYENGIKQNISGFEIISRKISGPGEEAALPSTVLRPKPRLFILIFDVFNYNDAIGEAIDYFFQTVFRPSDRILVMTENHFLIVEEGKNPDDLKTEIKSTLKQDKIVSMHNLQRTYMSLEEECQRLLDNIGDKMVSPTNSGGDFYQSISRFYEHYSRMWKDYRDRFLVPDLDVYQALLKRIKPIQADKWAICFRQRDLFPKLKNQGRLDRAIDLILEGQIDPVGQAEVRLIRSLQRQLEESFSLSRNFPAERLKNLFLEAGVTFHLILMKVSKPVLSLDLDLQEVGEDYEDCFRSISRSTGGSVTFSSKALEALKEAAEKEDYHYLLVYQSLAPLEERGKNIEVKVRQTGVQVYSLKQIQKLGGRAITVAAVRTEGKTLGFDLKGFTVMAADKGSRGIVEVRVTLFNDKSEKVFSEAKVLETKKEEIAIVLNFDQLPPGSYFLIIEAWDRITNEKDVQSRIVEF
jgi:hypothetical protein